jgi:hypothetical protein
LIEGWPNRLGNAEIIVNQSDSIRSIFDFKKKTRNDVDRLFSFSGSFAVVGVHIRRGDYMQWLDGVYYFTDEEYCRMMMNLRKQFAEKGEKVKFLLCSNEKINLGNYKDFDCFIIPDSSGVKDLYGLSITDYIIGPPSSFSQWASFYGKVPLACMMTANGDLKLSDFSVIISFNTFENGNVLDID